MNLEEDLLGGVLRGVAVAEEPIHEGVDALEMLLEERGQRFRITSAHPRQIQYVRAGGMCRAPT
jgi:hypothetical protein